MRAAWPCVNMTIAGVIHVVHVIHEHVAIGPVIAADDVGNAGTSRRWYLPWFGVSSTVVVRR